MSIPVAIGSALIQGGSGLLGSLFSGLSSSKAAREYNNGQMELAKYQFDKNLEMWNLQNQYNSPAAQMQRFKEAGLNPYLIYGQGSNGNATGMPEFQMPHQVQNSKADAINQATNALTNALGTYLSLKQQSEQNKLLHEQIESQKLANDSKRTENDYLKEYLDNRNILQRYNAASLSDSISLASALRGSVISSHLEDTDYNRWYHSFMKTHLPFVDEMQTKQFNLSKSNVLAAIKHMQVQDAISSMLAPYQRDLLYYNGLNRAEDFLSAYELRTNPFGSIKIPGTNMTVKQVMSAADPVGNLMIDLGAKAASRGWYRIAGALLGVGIPFIKSTEKW